MPSGREIVTEAFAAAFYDSIAFNELWQTVTP
jgi:hypothetical protein